jgi:hypothetical protein
MYRFSCLIVCAFFTLVVTIQALGWQMDGIDLPSAHTFVMNKLAPEFVEQRR